MILGTQRHAVARLTTLRSRGRFLDKRWFSDYNNNYGSGSQNEKAALLRALAPSPKDVSSRGDDRNRRTSPKIKSTAVNVGARGRKQHDRDRRPSKKNSTTTTLDDFFSNLKSTRNTTTRSRKRPPERIQRQEQPLSGIDNQNDVETNKKVDIGSFFDEVNEIMKQNKAKKQEASSADRKMDMFSLKDSGSISTRASIFDMLPPPKSLSPNAYDEEAYEQYSDILERVMESPRFLRKTSSMGEEKARSIVEWLKADEPVVSCNLPFLEKVQKEGLSSREEEAQVAELLSSELAVQRQVLMDHCGWDKNQYELAVGALATLGNLCAKNATAPPLDVAWPKLKEAGYKMNKGVLHNYLYVCSTFSVRSLPTISSKGGSVLDFLSGIKNEDNESADKDNQEPIVDEHVEEETVDIASEVALCHDFLFEPSEQSTSIRVRMLVAQGKAKEAERLLDINSKSDDLRLRTYAPVYQCYLEQGDVSSAFKLFAKMKKGEFVILQPEIFVQLMACIAENGYFRPDAEPIEGVSEMGYSEGSGTALFDALATELATNAVEITSASAKCLYNAFQSGFENHNLKSLHLLESLKTENEPAGANELVVGRVTLSKTTGCCSRTGAQLRLINLDAEEKKQLQEGLTYLSGTTYEERHQKKNSKAEDELERFAKWLENRGGEPFTAIVDGPNVAYYMQNFEQGCFNFHQIKFVVDALENMGENVLVTLPQKYSQRSFLVTKQSGSVRQVLSPKERQIRDDLISSGKAYIVQKGCLDDYYWMYASVSSQSNSMIDEDTYVAPGNSEGRWPGIRPMLISNDKMRDHKLSLLEPRLFRRWYSNFIVNFTFSAFVGEECVDKEIGFSTADFYSREIQGNAVVDEDGSDYGIAWHFPVSDWDDNESFCIRIPK